MFNVDVSKEEYLEANPIIVSIEGSISPIYINAEDARDFAMELDRAADKSDQNSFIKGFVNLFKMK